jgi:hypothetical protein
MSLGPYRALNSGFARRRYTDLHLYRIVQRFQECIYIGYRDTRMPNTKPTVWINELTV